MDDILAAKKTAGNEEAAATKSKIVIDGQEITDRGQYADAVKAAKTSHMYNGFPIESTYGKKLMYRDELMMNGKPPEAAQKLADERFGVTVSQAKQMSYPSTQRMGGEDALPKKASDPPHDENRPGRPSWPRFAHR